jgi:radical SAM/Cys-rich protein
LISCDEPDELFAVNRFEHALQAHGLELRRTKTRVLQLNIGKKCNQTCAHCHVNAGPARSEMMTRETMERVLSWLETTEIPVVDITGGAPELNPHFCFLVEAVRRLNRRVIDRCNLTVLFEPGQERLAEFLAAHEVEVVASLPCYEAPNVEAQRGEGVYEKSIRALQRLNALGYGRDSKLPLNLVYNPGGAFLPPSQEALEAVYREELRKTHNIEFDHLWALANMPIARFAAQLRREGVWDDYAQLLLDNFNFDAVGGLMCRDTLNVGWTGEVYDCDFNGMLHMAWTCESHHRKLWELDPLEAEGRSIATGSHCLGCTAGAGSSCGGALA